VPAVLLLRRRAQEHDLHAVAARSRRTSPRLRASRTSFRCTLPPPRRGELISSAALARHRSGSFRSRLRLRRCRSPPPRVQARRRQSIPSGLLSSGFAPAVWRVVLDRVPRPQEIALPLG
jgi:hypothetical protein